MDQKKIEIIVLCLTIVIMSCCDTKKDYSNEDTQKVNKKILFEDIKKITNIIIGDTILNLPDENKKGMILDFGLDIIDNYPLSLNEIEYQVGVRTNGVIKFISTNDVNFKTADKLSIGDTYKEVKNKLEFNNLEHKRGYALFLELRDQWCASFKIDDHDNIGDKDDPNRRIDFFFKK